MGKGNVGNIERERIGYNRNQAIIDLVERLGDGSTKGAVFYSPVRVSAESIFGFRKDLVDFSIWYMRQNCEINLERTSAGSGVWEMGYDIKEGKGINSSTGGVDNVYQFVDYNVELNYDCVFSGTKEQLIDRLKIELESDKRKSMDNMRREGYLVLEMNEENNVNGSLEDEVGGGE